MGWGLNKADIATRSYLLAAIFSLIKENREMTNAQRNTQQLLADLQIRLDVTFSLTPEQKVCSHSLSVYSYHIHFLQSNVCIIAGDVLSDPSHITFMSMHFDVKVSITDQYSPLY